MLINRISKEKPRRHFPCSKLHIIRVRCRCLDLKLEIAGLLDRYCTFQKTRPHGYKNICSRQNILRNIHHSLPDSLRVLLTKTVQAIPFSVKIRQINLNRNTQIFHSLSLDVGYCILLSYFRDSMLYYNLGTVLVSQNPRPNNYRSCMKVNNKGLQKAI